MVTKHTNIDLSYNSGLIIDNIQKDDNMSRQIDISLYHDGTPYTIPDGAIIMLQWDKPDGTTVLENSNGSLMSISNDIVSIILSNQMTAVEGLVNAKLSVIYNSSTLYSTLFKVKIDGGLIPEDKIISSDEYNALVNSTEQADVATQKCVDATALCSAQTTKCSDATALCSTETTKCSDATALCSAQTKCSDATAVCINATNNIQEKLDSHHFVLTEDKNTANGIPSLDSNTKIPISELYEATTSSKGITQLTDSVTSTSTTTAATPNSVKQVKDSLSLLDNDLSNEISRAKAAEKILEDNLAYAKAHADSAHAPSNAEKNVLIGIQRNGTDLAIDSNTRKINVSVPSKTSELVNDSGYKTTDNNTTYSISKSGSTITLTGSDGSKTSVTTSAIQDGNGNVIDDTYLKISNLLDAVYPIGSIYISANSINPTTLFGGTWEAWGSGRVPVGVDSADNDFNTAEKEGGEKAHTLTTDEMPSHTHDFTGTTSSHTHNFTGTSVASGTISANHTHTIPALTVSSSGKHTHSTTAQAVSDISYVVSSNGIKNYLMWKSANAYEGSSPNASGIRPTANTGDAGYESIVTRIPALSISSSGAHTHTTDSGKTGNQSSNHTHNVTANGTNSNTSITPTGTNSSVGNNTAHNNLQPYITCYMWKRTA